MEGTIGEIRAFAGNSGGMDFVPRGWRLCDGSLLPIGKNVAVFAILGTTYGGDGVSNFALPDLRSRVPIGTGTAPGRPSYGLGERAGAEQVPTQQLELRTGDRTVNAVASGARSNVQPVFGLNYIICVEGVFPTKD